MIGKDDILIWEINHTAALARKDQISSPKSYNLRLRLQLVNPPRELTKKCGKEGESSLNNFKHNLNLKGTYDIEWTASSYVFWEYLQLENYFSS